MAVPGRPSCFTAVCYFFSSWDLWGPWADLREILPHCWKHVQFTNAGPKNWGLAPCKKHANFGPISNPFPLWARISPEWIEISKIQKLLDRQRFLLRWPKKFGELWSTNYGDLEVQLYSKNRTFRNTIFGPLGCAVPRNFYTCLRMSKYC